jgi:hypothetical protein
MKEIKKEFIEFVTRQENPPAALSLSTKRDIQLSFKKRSILSKFILYQLLGAFFTLTFCPQFGVGFIEGHGITHIFRVIGDWACAAFCGSLFLSAGMVISYIGMKGEELWWVWRHYKFSLVLLPAVMWSSLMLMNVSFETNKESITYHATWIISAILAQIFWLSLRSKIHSFSFARAS